jgi:hypothetical protein
LLFGVLADDRQRDAAAGRGEVGRGPWVLAVGADFVPLLEFAHRYSLREFTRAVMGTLGGYSASR